MPKLVGVFKFEGTLGDVTAYKNKRGDIVLRSKGGVSAKQIASGENFKRTRENNKEFGASAKGASIVRNSLKSLISYLNPYAHNELVKLLRKKIEQKTGVRGERVPENADISEDDLQAILFTNSFEQASRVLPTLNIAGNGDISLNFAPTSADLTPPPTIGTLAYRVGLVGGVCDLATEYTGGNQTAPSSWADVDSPISIALNLTMDTITSTGQRVIAVAWIEFAEKIGTNYYPLANRYFFVKSAIATA
jgi:hypothetical protein